MSDSFEQRCQNIVTRQTLSPEQKRHFLALKAENALPYPALSPSNRARGMRALFAICLKDILASNRATFCRTTRVLAHGSQWLERESAIDLDDALSLLTILFHHVPPVTLMAVYLAHLDQILSPHVKIITQKVINIRIKHVSRYLARRLSDAFTDVNTGLQHTPVTRAILRADAELKLVAPNLTFIYDPDVTPQDRLLEVRKTIRECSKPHIANDPLNDKIFTKDHYGIVNCSNSATGRRGQSPGPPQSTRSGQTQRLSGGEATTQLPFITELFAALKATPSLRHLTCPVDSNGDPRSQRLSGISNR